MLNAVKYEFHEAPQVYWDFAHEYGTIFQSKPYLSSSAASGREQFIVEVLDDKELVGGTTFTVGRRVFNRSVNATTFYGPVVKKPQMLVDILTCIIDAIGKTAFIYRLTLEPEYANIIANSAVMSKWRKERNEILYWDISGEMDSFWKRLPKGKKAAINRARRENIVIKEVETSDDVKEFQRLYVMSMVRGGLIPASPESHQNLFRILRPLNMAVGFLAWYPAINRPIAAILLLLDKNGRAIYSLVGHDYEYRNVGAADFLMWHSVEFLKSKGFVLFNMLGLPSGDSKRARGIRHHKLTWAGDDGRRYQSFVLVVENGVCAKIIARMLSFRKTISKFIRTIFRRESAAVKQQ